MLFDTNGRRIKAEGLRSIGAVKAQFRKAGHYPGTVAELEQLDGFVWAWACECGASLRFTWKGRLYGGLYVTGDH